MSFTIIYYLETRFVKNSKAFGFSFVPILTQGHEFYEMTSERIRLQLQASEMRWLRRMYELQYFNKYTVLSHCSCL